MRYVFLPPYSPDYNPIELAFSSIKAHVQHSGELLRLDADENDDTYVYLHLLNSAYRVTGDNALGFFYCCGYV